MAIIEKEIKLVGSKGEHELIGLFDSGATYSPLSTLTLEAKRGVLSVGRRV